MKLGSIDLESVPFFFIAEAGINHNGSIENAKKLIDMAKETGSDCVKFQKRTISRILTRDGLNAPYDNDNSFGKTYGEHKEFLEFSCDQFKEIKRYADQVGIMMTASGWDEESVDFLDSLNVPFFKMASADLTNWPLLEHTAKKGRPMILSTGMADLETVKKTYQFVKQWNNDLVIMQCTSSYPTPDCEIHLKVIEKYKEEFPGTIIGFSGHEKGISISQAAFVLGAKVIERHFTLDRTMKGGDHAASLEKQGLEKLIRDLRVLSSALGSNIKSIQPSEVACFKKLTKSVVSTRRLEVDHIITRDDLTTKGPGASNDNDGINPMNLYKLIGCKVLKFIEDDQIIPLKSIELELEFNLIAS
jgi:sialic acid synthase